MAVPLNFKPVPVDPHLELQRRLAAAPQEHAEALLVAYDILQTAHDKGILDTVHGLVSARDKIAGKLAELAHTPEGKTGARNLLESAKLFASIDPSFLEHLNHAVANASLQHQQEQTSPSLWQIFKRVTSEDGRRGLSFMTLLLTSLGRARK